MRGCQRFSHHCQRRAFIVTRKGDRINGVALCNREVTPLEVSRADNARTRIVAEFPNTDKGMTAANAYMEAYADTGLLATTPAHLILAKLADKGVPAYPKAPA